MDNSGKKQFLILFAMHAKTLMREPAVLFWGIVFPMLMALGLGLAFTQKLDTVNKVSVINSSESSGADSLNRFEIFLKKRTEKIKDSLTRQDQYKIIVNDKKLGNSTYIFERSLTMKQ